jgi:hypothetical protein
MQAAAESCARPDWRMFVIGALVACAVAILARTAAAETFAARQTHRGFTTDQGDGTTGALVAPGFPRHAGDPTFVYEAGGVPLAGVWSNGDNTEVVRSGTSENAPVLGRIVPSWDDAALRLTIEPVGSAAIRTDVFASGGRQHGPTLSRDISTRADLEGTYRATLRSDGGARTGWLSVRVDPDGGTRFRGDLPATIPPALAAAAAEALDREVDVIYDNVVDVGPLSR